MQCTCISTQYHTHNHLLSRHLLPAFLSLLLARTRVDWRRFWWCCLVWWHILVGWYIVKSIQLINIRHSPVTLAASFTSGFSIWYKRQVRENVQLTNTWKASIIYVQGLNMTSSYQFERSYTTRDSQISNSPSTASRIVLNLCFVAVIT